MKKKNNKLFITVCIFSILFVIAIAINLSPFLRGPLPYPPDWRWGYLPTAFSLKTLLPLPLVALVLFLLYLYEKTSHLKNPKFLIAALIIVGFLLQITLLASSRAGLAVIIERIIDPLISGYFTVSLHSHPIPIFLQNFTSNLYKYSLYPKFHPPAGVLLFTFIDWVAGFGQVFFPFLTKMTPHHADIAVIWNGLSAPQKLSAFISGFIVAFLSYTTLIPLYFSAKLLYGEKTAVRSIFLFMFVPNVLLFTPLNDVFFPLFTVWSLYYFLKAIETNKLTFYFLAGFILFVGLSFNLSYLPLLIMFAILYILKKKIKTFTYKQLPLKESGIFAIGLLIAPILLFLFYHLNYIAMSKQIMYFHESAQHTRNYWVWIFGNLYDFFMFTGVTVAALFFFIIYALFKKTYGTKKSENSLFIAFAVCSYFLI